MPFIKNNHSQDSQPSAPFIGRTDEILFFIHNILRPEVPTHNILSISGQGGVGKSTLLDRLIAETHEAPFKDYCLTASVDERQATPIAMMQKLAQELHLVGKFEKTLKQYKEALRKQQAEQETLHDTLFKGVPEVAGAAIEGIPVAGPLLREGTKIAITHFLKEHQALQLQKGTALLEIATDELTKAFVAELNSLADKEVTLSSSRKKRHRRIILFFDTFEQLAAETTPWLLDHFLKTQVSGNIVLVVAGRDSIEHTCPDDPKRWLPYCDDNTIYRISLNSFTEDETRVYLAKRGVTDADQVENIWHLSRGLPLYLGLLTSNPHRDIDPTKEVVVNFLCWIPEQEAIKRQLALDAALLSRPFNQDDLGVFSSIAESHQASLYQWLTKQPFVRGRSQDGRYLYHDVARDLFSRHQYQCSQKQYYETRRVLATYYLELLEMMQAERGKEVYRSEEWLELLLAVVSQLLLLPDQTSHIQAVGHVLRAYDGKTNIDQDTAIARYLRDFSQDLSSYHISPAAREIAIQLLHYIEKHQDQERIAASETLLKTIAHVPSFPSELLAGVYASRGYAYYSLGEYRRAIEDIQLAYTLGKRSQDVALTQAYLKLGDREQSFAYFNHLVTSNPTDAWAYDRRGWNYFYFGENELALSDFDHTLILDVSNDSAYLGKGWVYYNLKEYQQAITALTRALELDPKLGYAYGCLSLICQSLNDRQQAAAYLDRFVDVAPKYFDAYAYRGNFLFDSQQYQQALVNFDRAIELATERIYLYRKRGLTYLWLKDLQQAQADFIRCYERAPTQIYFVLMTEWTELCQGVAGSHVLERLETIVEVGPPRYSARICQGIVLLLRRYFNEALAELEQALQQNRDENWEAPFWKGVACAFLLQDEEAIASVEKALELGLPPILLAPLRWFEQERPDFYGKYAVPLLAKYD